MVYRKGFRKRIQKQINRAAENSRHDQVIEYTLE
jgi:hypothetical protein